MSKRVIPSFRHSEGEMGTRAAPLRYMAASALGIAFLSALAWTSPAGAETNIRIRLLGPISEVVGVPWPGAPAKPEGMAYAMGAEWSVDVRLPEGGSVKLNVKSMYQFEQSCGVVTRIKLYPMKDKVQFNEVLNLIEASVRELGLKAGEGFTAKLAEWRITPADRLGNGWNLKVKVPLDAKSNAVFQLMSGRGKTGLAWQYLLQIEPDRKAKKAAIAQAALRKCRKPLFVIERSTSWNSAAFTPDGSAMVVVDTGAAGGLFSAKDGSVVKQWDLRSAAEAELRTATPYCLAASRDGTRLAAGFEKGILVVAGIPDGEPSVVLKAGKDAVCKAISRDLSKAAFVREKAGEIWDIKEQRKILELPAQTRRVENLEFSPDGASLAVMLQHDSSLHLFSTADGTKLKEIKPQPGAGLLTVRFSADGKRLLAGGHMAGNASMWDVNDGRMLLKMNTRGQYAIAISPDGALAAASTWSTMDYESISVHRTSDGEQLLELGWYEKPVRTLCFSPDARLLAATLKGGKVAVWETRATAGKTKAIGQLTVIAEKASIYRGKDVVGTAKKGDTFAVSAIKGDWYGVLPTRGWIHKKFIEYQPDGEAK